VTIDVNVNADIVDGATAVDTMAVAVRFGRLAGNRLRIRAVFINDPQNGINKGLLLHLCFSVSRRFRPADWFQG